MIKGLVFNRAKGERADAYMERAHRLHLREWANEKKSKGQWLSKADFEKKTGRPGKS